MLKCKCTHKLFKAYLKCRTNCTRYLILVYNYGQIKREHRDIICFQLADNDLLYITELASLLSLLHTTSSAFKSEANQFPGNVHVLINTSVWAKWRWSHHYMTHGLCVATSQLWACVPIRSLKKKKKHKMEIFNCSTSTWNLLYLDKPLEM